MLPLLLAEISSNEWLGIAAIAATSTAGWVAVLVKLAGLSSDMKHLSKVVGNGECERKRMWEHIGKHDGQLHTIERLGDRIAEQLRIAPRNRT